MIKYASSQRPEGGWEQRIEALRSLRPLLGLVFRYHPAYTVAVILSRLLRAVIPVGLIWIGKLIIEAIEAHYHSSRPLDWNHLGLLLLLEMVMALASDAVARASTLLESLLGELVGRKMSIRIMRHAGTLDLAQFEDPTTYDRMQRAAREVEGKLAFLIRMLDTLQDAVTLISLVAAVALFVPWLIILLAVSVLPAFAGESRFATLRYSLLFGWTPERRRLDYLRQIAASDKSAKEVKLLRLSPFLIGRYAKLSWDYFLAQRRLSTRQALVGAALASIGTLGYYGAYATIIYLTAIGHSSPGGPFTIGVLTLLAASFRQSRDIIQRILFALAGLYEQGLYAKDLFLFLGTEPRVTSRPGAISIPKEIRAGFVFDGVSFRYPGSSRWALRDLSFTIQPNQALGLVGDNGAGKTTVVKLLSRLYDPDEGRILLDGIDLRNYELSDLWANIAVIFQDYMRYEMSFKENIGVGLVSHVNDSDRIREAARCGHADTVAEGLERGFEQQLGRQFEGGIELSGGEWQKVALSRAYMRDAQVMIFDEPTASLDARSEYEVFRRVTDLARDRISLIISHRFSTVRAADRILVLQHGQLVEEGSHDALVALDGIYAELFGLQAAGYR